MWDRPSVSIRLLIIQYDYCIEQQLERSASESDTFRLGAFKCYVRTYGRDGGSPLKCEPMRTRVGWGLCQWECSHIIFILFKSFLLSSKLEIN